MKIKVTVIIIAISRDKVIIPEIITVGIAVPVILVALVAGVADAI